MIKIKLSKTNCYLLQISEGYLLIDTGYEIEKLLLYFRKNLYHLNGVPQYNRQFLDLFDLLNLFPGFFEYQIKSTVISLIRGLQKQ